MEIDNNFFNKNLNFVEVNMDDNGVLKGKSKMSDRLGFLPSTIWTPDKRITSLLKKEVGDFSQIRKSLNNNKAYRRNGINGGKTSVFNPHLAQMILAAYCEYDSKIYDPFAGGGTRGYISKKMGHEYFGVEIREEEVERIKSMFNKWNFEFDIIVGDSAIFKPKEDEYDFSFTCPPYYDLEKYSNLEGDLSNYKSYSDFLIGIKNVLNNTYNSLKKGSFCVWVVGNFRDKSGKMFHLNGDVIRIAQDIGFTFWDEIIWNGASTAALGRCGNFLYNRKAVRIHEYIIVLKKV